MCAYDCTRAAPPWQTRAPQREVQDYHRSRSACYPIAYNGDPRRPEIANAQKYLAGQSRRQELSDAYAADLERLELRKQTSGKFRPLSGAAQEAGVQSRVFGVFHDAGYKGMYGGLDVDAIKDRKGIPPDEHIREVEKRIAKAKPKLEPVDQDARGSIGDEENV